MKKILSIALLLTTSAFANEEGKELHDESCVACHIAVHDDAFYTRDNSRIKTLFDLKSQVSRCAVNFSTEWFPDEEASVVDYLNQKYYHYKK